MYHITSLVKLNALYYGDRNLNLYIGTSFYKKLEIVLIIFHVCCRDSSSIFICPCPINPLSVRHTPVDVLVGWVCRAEQTIFVLTQFYLKPYDTMYSDTSCVPNKSTSRPMAPREIKFL